MGAWTRLVAGLAAATILLTAALTAFGYTGQVEAVATVAACQPPPRFRRRRRGGMPICVGLLVVLTGLAGGTLALGGRARPRVDGSAGHLLIEAPIWLAVP